MHGGESLAALITIAPASFSLAASSPTNLQERKRNKA
jgi:hypothetical protein